MSKLMNLIAALAILLFTACDFTAPITTSSDNAVINTNARENRNGRGMSMGPDLVLVARDGSHYASGTVEGLDTYWVYTAYADIANDGAISHSFSIDGLQGNSVEVVTSQGSANEKRYYFTNAWFVEVRDLEGSEDIRIYLDEVLDLNVAVQYQ